ncbi:MAG: hypothetical protein GY929_01015 [Actinomycetia bacterium]|nr:hypothetical protein [Actinomycetes bacterium]
MNAAGTGPPQPGDASQGDVLAVWAMWGLLLIAIGATYTRLDPTELYHVSRDGLAGGLSRVLVETNYPIALFAIAPVLIALDRLGPRWWWLGGPTIAACALTIWPGVVDDGNLDARMINVIPALGVATALALTVIATRRTSAAVAPQRRFDPARRVLVPAVLFLSLPWIFAAAGFYLPEVGFISERAITGSNGLTEPAVHLGDHHGFSGALLLISALILSRTRLAARGLAIITAAYVSLMGAYGAIISVQDLTREQINKRGWIEWRIPDAVKPSLTPIWLIILALAAAAFLAIRYEADQPTTTARGLR